MTDMVRSILLLLSITFLSLESFSQLSPHKDYPILFYDVQTQSIFPNSKIFPNCIPLLPKHRIDSCYLVEKQTNGFNLKDYVETYFVIPVQSSSKYQSDTSFSIEEHINNTLEELLVDPKSKKSSLISLPYPYIIPGERFKEVYYWDSYFTMLGLARIGKIELIENIIKNFAWMLDTFGYIPNGNRTYYLSRSQPPYFSLMVQLLSAHKGEQINIEYLPYLEKEYKFWMKGSDRLSDSIIAVDRVVRLPDGTILNRYWDNVAQPRPEAFLEDIELARKSPLPDSVDYRNIRAACESSWDYSSRWLRDKNKYETIETTNILPIDLNCLIYNLEKTLSEIYNLKKDKKTSKHYAELAATRKNAINKIFWDKDSNFYCDYNFVNAQHSTSHNLAGLYPLFFKIAPNKYAKESATFTEDNFLKPGGLVTSLSSTGLQWDAPYGWAPLQYIGIIGLENYGVNSLAEIVKQRWINTNNKIYKETGELLEKYKVENTQFKDGDYEYPRKNGFGYTHGILLELLLK